MTRKQKKHIPSVKIVSENIDKKWKYDYETKTFSHSLYPNKTFKAICDNKTKAIYIMPSFSSISIVIPPVARPFSFWYLSTADIVPLPTAPSTGPL